MAPWISLKAWSLEHLRKPLSCWNQITLLLVISHLHKLTTTTEGIPRCGSQSSPNKKFFWQMFYVFTCFPKKSYTVLKANAGSYEPWVSTNPCVTLWESFRPQPLKNTVACLFVLYCSSKLRSANQSSSKKQNWKPQTNKLRTGNQVPVSFM